MTVEMLNWIVYINPCTFFYESVDVVCSCTHELVACYALAVNLILIYASFAIGNFRFFIIPN